MKQQKNLSSSLIFKLDTYKEKSIQQELKSLRKKVLSLEKHFQPERQTKYHSQPKLLPTKLTPKITEQIPIQSNVKKVIPFKHHLDDSEIKSILWNQYNYNIVLYENNDSQHQPQRKQKIDSQPIIPQYLPRNNSQNDIHPLSYRENSDHQQTQRSSYHTSQVDSLQSRNSPQFKDEIIKFVEREQDSLRKCRTKTSQKSVIKNQRINTIRQDKEQYRSNHIQKEDELTNNIENISLNPFNNTPQNKLFQPCQSTHFGSGQECSAKQHQNQPQDSNANVERKLFNVDEIASSFFKFSLPKKSKSASQSSASSNFSLFNPNHDLKNFFQQLGNQVGNSISFQF